MSDEEPGTGESSSQSDIESELADWLPNPGDRLFLASPTGARLDPLGLTPYGEPRRTTGRWQLYADGFLAAADRLVESLKGLPWEDELIYPVLAHYRHHLELQLKYVLFCCPGCTHELRQWLARKHSLRELWEKVKEVYPRFSEWASAECTEACQKLIEDFNQHDPTSQASRYPVDTKGKPTLPELEVIDLQAVKRAVHKVSHYLGTIIEQIGQDREWQAEMGSW
ncbi:MAG: hypothetical protein ACE5HL_00950 [Terriglobia bacterium]